jgi:hypothetical protein
MENEMVKHGTLQKAILFITIGFLSAGTLLAQQQPEDSSAFYRCFVGSTAFMLGNLASDPPSLYQLNIGYRITPKDVISLEAITWKYHAPLGIPYGSSWGEKSEDYPGSIREYGIGVVYQRFIWKGLYTSLQIIPFKRTYRDADNNTIQKGFQLFSTLRIGFQIPLFKNRFFLEPSIAATFWPVSTNVPQGFAAKDTKWNKFFLFEPGLHFGINF